MGAEEADGGRNEHMTSVVNDMNFQESHVFSIKHSACLASGLPCEHCLLVESGGPPMKSLVFSLHSAEFGGQAEFLQDPFLLPTEILLILTGVVLLPWCLLSLNLISISSLQIETEEPSQ